MSLIRLHSVGKQYGRTTVLREVFFRLDAGDKVGLIGRNGSGKTTLIELILGRQEPSEGVIERERDLKIGYFSQFSELNEARSIEEILEEQFTELHEMERELHRIGDRLGRPETDAAAMQALLERQAELLEEMERRDGWTYHNRIDTVLTKQGIRIGQKLCRVEQLAKAYDEQRIVNELTLEIHKEDRLAVVGPNGVGKSTFLRLLTRQEDPDHGRVIWEGGIRWSFFNETLEELDPDATITRYVNLRGMAYAAQQKHVHRFLGMLRFSEMDLTRRIGTLSGGERARVALAVSLLSGAAVIVLDEPTNHLDITTTQVMEQALIHFPGAVVVASHDRFFIDKVATRLLLFEGEGRVRLVEGNWTTWQAGYTEDQVTV